MKLSYRFIFIISIVIGLLSILLFGGNGILVSIVSVVLLVILKRIIGKPKDIKIIEKWGEYISSKSGVEWGIPRQYHCWDNGPKSEDSRHILEQYGFTILGIANEVLYSVEPPLGWKQEALSELHTYILDEEGKKRLYVFLKNDIMNPNDYRGFISEKVD